MLESSGSYALERNKHRPMLEMHSLASVVWAKGSLRLAAYWCCVLVAHIYRPIPEGAEVIASSIKSGNDLKSVLSIDPPAWWVGCQPIMLKTPVLAAGAASIHNDMYCRG